MDSTAIVLTVIGTVLVPILLVWLGPKIVKRASYTETWDEMRKLRADLNSMDGRVSELRIYRDVVDILLPHIDAIIPNLTEDERRTVERARKLLETRTSD